ncbi:hypothetical protein ACIO13_08500 [Streptomyces sp. NPDC087425]|uniref:hypothetical protein n=1 Tax=Streptomyces sp. NPDC087425 TaxID=3365787 RepID=UPI0038257BC5
MAAMPAAEVTAAEQMRDLEEMATYLAGELADALDLAGRQLVSKSHGIANEYEGLVEAAEKLADGCDELTEEIDDELAEAE